MPQNAALENHNLWMQTAKLASHSCYGGVADLIQEEAQYIGCGPDGILSRVLVVILLLRTTDVTNGFPPPYA